LLSEEQKIFYEKNGYILIEGLIPVEEAAMLRAECHRLVERLNQRHQNIDATWGSARETISEAKNSRLLHCHNVQFESAAFARLIVDERFTDVAAELIGSPNVQLHHNKMFIKPPEKGSPFPLHQDYPYFPHQGMSMTAAIFHFDDAPLEKGCVRVIPGSYKNGPLPHDSSGSHHLSPAEYPLEMALPCPAKAGDVLFFNYLTVHGSGLNTSQEARTTLLVQFRRPDDLPLTQVHDSRGQGMMLRGINQI
jgi:phytanoyl-CoA hydroxylase